MSDFINNTENLPKHLFWDINTNLLDKENSKTIIIERVFNRGDINDVKIIISQYGLETIKQEIVKAGFLDKKTLNWVCLFLNIPKTKFRCYKKTIETNTPELLIKLQADKTLKAFHLAGGTSLALQIGHRKSVDLDLFTQTDFDTNFLLEYLEQNFNFKADYTAQNILKGSINNIKLDLISHKYALVKSILNTDNIRLYSIEDIAAMKLNAIAGNGTRSKDFIDIYFILKNYTLNDVLSFYGTKYKDRNLLHIVKSLNYFDDINIQDWPEMILEQNLSLRKVKESLKKQVFDFSENL